MRSNPADVTTRASGESYTKALSPTFAPFCLNLRWLLKKISVPICQILLRGNILPGCSGSSTREFLWQWRKLTEETAWKIWSFPHLQSYIYTAMRCKFIYIRSHTTHTHRNSHGDCQSCQGTYCTYHFFNPKLICLSPGNTNTASHMSNVIPFHV